MVNELVLKMKGGSGLRFADAVHIRGAVVWVSTARTRNSWRGEGDDVPCVPSVAGFCFLWRYSSVAVGLWRSKTMWRCRVVGCVFFWRRRDVGGSGNTSCVDTGSGNWSLAIIPQAVIYGFMVFTGRGALLNCHAIGWSLHLNTTMYLWHVTLESDSIIHAEHKHERCVRRRHFAGLVLDVGG